MIFMQVNGLRIIVGEKQVILLGRHVLYEEIMVIILIKSRFITILIFSGPFY